MRVEASCWVVVVEVFADRELMVAMVAQSFRIDAQLKTSTKLLILATHFFPFEPLLVFWDGVVVHPDFVHLLVSLEKAAFAAGRWGGAAGRRALRVFTHLMR